MKPCSSRKSRQKYCHVIPPQPDQVSEIPFIVTEAVSINFN